MKQKLVMISLYKTQGATLASKRPMAPDNLLFMPSYRRHKWQFNGSWIPIYAGFTEL